MIEIEQVSKDFSLNRKQMKQSGATSPRVRVVDNVSFQCQPGRVFSLLGPNGAGKTTLLRMVATILRPTAGSIRVAGIDALREPNAVRAKIGFMTGSTGLYDRLTPNEIIRYFADLYGMPRDRMKKRRQELYDLLDMNDFASKKVGQLSTGMRQKVSIVRTMIHDPEVVVFDEPTSGLDVITAENIIKLVEDCKTQGKTVIFSSHIMSEVDLLADDLAIIHKGRLVFHDTMDHFRSQMQAPTLTKEFIRLVTESQTANA